MTEIPAPLLPPAGLLHPRCGRCDTPVRDFRVTYTGDQVRIQAWCHGDKRQLVIPRRDLERFFREGAGRGVEVTIGPLFTGQKLEIGARPALPEDA